MDWQHIRELLNSEMASGIVSSSLARLLLAAILGGVIGLERELRHRPAGLRTNMFICFGAALFTILSDALAVEHLGDHTRISAQIIPGIGFIGAGSILLRGQVVRGLTTAASIWAVAAIGLAAGGGLFYAAIISTVIILAILAGVKPLEEAYRARVQSCTFAVTADKDALDLDNLKKLLGVRANQIKRALMQEGPEGLLKLDVQLSRVSRSEISQAAARLRREPGVHEVEVADRRRRGRSAGIRTD